MKRLFIVYGLLLTINPCFAKESIVDLKIDVSTNTQAIATVQDKRPIRITDVKKQVSLINTELTRRTKEKQEITRIYNAQIATIDQETVLLQSKLTDLTDLQTQLKNLGVKESVVKP